MSKPWSKSWSRSWPKFGCRSAAIAVGAAAFLAVITTTPVANAANTLTYQVHPLMKLAIPTDGPTAGGFPMTPSQCVAADGVACYGPGDLRTGYGIPADDLGAGQTVVIVDAFGSPTIASDLATYDAEFGLPPANLHIFAPDGQPAFDPTNTDEVGWAQETSLDVEQVHGLAPAANIDLVVALSDDDADMDNAEAFAIDHHLGSVLSMSFGEPESSVTATDPTVVKAEQLYNLAAREQMTVFASSGDTGATEGTPAVTALFPASDPLVTSVGGTNLFLSDSGVYQSEDVWNDDSANCPFGCTQGLFGATGGGPSTLFRAPSFQVGTTRLPFRTTSDVSFNASVYTATLIFLSVPGITPGFYFFGGTSEGSPSWAAITAIADSAIGHPLGQLSPRLYEIAHTAAYRADFHDVTVGDNDFEGPGFPAGFGYDLPTGLGTPVVGNLIHSLAFNL